MLDIFAVLNVDHLVCRFVLGVIDFLMITRLGTKLQALPGVISGRVYVGKYVGVKAGALSEPLLAYFTFEWCGRGGGSLGRELAGIRVTLEEETLSFGGRGVASVTAGVLRQLWSRREPLLTFLAHVMFRRL